MSLTKLWVTVRRHEKWVWPAVALVITFGAGWQVGKVTSPYYAAHPIIFHETAATSPVETTKLESLFTPSSPKPTVAGSKTSAEARFVGSVNSTLYHDMSCPSASRIKPANQVWFASKEEAEAAGYSPSQCTKEKLGLP